MEQTLKYPDWGIETQQTVELYGGCHRLSARLCADVNSFSAVHWTIVSNTILRSKYLGGFRSGIAGFPHSSLHLNVKQMMKIYWQLSKCLWMFSDYISLF
jgi:hypothetical protein